jgi:hypothetical protein
VNTPEPVENVITIHGKRYKLVELTWQPTAATL